ncbi:MAG: arginine--tRNA ligase [Pseudomonadales bacterium]|jgi:arginyl-tRNA synthetase|nr:arginine--tRNA ligase [Pseudomonadales bacterium]
MKTTLRAELEARIARALAAAGAPDAPGVVQPAARPEFGDYQANGVMGAAKRLKRKPRELAEQVLELAELDDLVAKAEIAGPGFINLTLSDATLADALARLPTAVLAPAAAAEDAPPVVVDYSAPNLAKEMHVGHLRSTIIGDAVVRTLEHTGHRVIRQNHVGDWGTQFGMLLTYMDELQAGGDAAALSHELSDLETFYRNAKTRFDDDAAFAERARQTVVRLQSGDRHCRQRWAEFIEVSLSHCETLYDRLGVTLTRADVMAESAYNDDLAQTVADLDAAGLLTESDGAQCVFLEEFKGKDDAPLPLIVRKSDGGYLYATTDLAAVRHRHGTLHTERALYFVDKRQTLHFRQVFAVARAAGFAPASMSLEHMPFGTMLGEDGRPFRTRAGDVVKLSELLDEAEERAFALVSEKNPDLPEAERREIARVVGIGAVKYADLSKNRTSDYVFAWDAMLSFDGNTAPYLQYACSRIRSLFRRAELDREAFEATPSIEAPAERALALTLVRLPETLEQVVATGQPHLLCNHLYEIATGFTAFYEQCPVLSAAGPTRDARLALAKRTGQALETGLGLLGIEVLERM